MADHTIKIRNHAAVGSEVFDLGASIQLSNVSFQLVNISDGDLFSINETTGQISLNDIAKVDWTGQVIRNVEISLLVNDVETERVSIDFVINDYDTTLTTQSSITTFDYGRLWQDHDLEFFGDGAGYAIAYLGGGGWAGPIHVDLVDLSSATASTIDIYPADAEGRNNVDIAISPNGDYFAVAWEEYQEIWDSAAAEWINGTSVNAQVFNIDGTAKSAAFQVSPHAES